MKKIITTLIFVFTVLILQAQDQKETGMADLLRSNGKIYVVVAVVVTILVGLLLYLVRLERKIKRLERENG